MNWKIGQKVVCIKRSVWIIQGIGSINHYGPKYNEVCHIEAIHIDGYLQLKEYPVIGRLNWYVSSDFRPLESHSAHISEAVRSSLPAIIEEGRDVPAEQPAPVAICGNTNPLTSLLTMIRTDGTMTACGGKVPVWVVMK